MNEEALDTLPEGWVWTKLWEVAEKIVDGSHNPPPKQDIGVPMLSAQNIWNNKIVFSKYRYISSKDHQNEINRVPIEAGDVLLTIVGTIGRSAVVKESTPQFAIQRSVALIKPKITPEYLSLIFQSPFHLSYLLKNAKGTAQKGIYLNQLKEIPIQIAPLPEQRAIVSKIEQLFSDLDSGIENFKKAQEQLKIYRQAVLKNACEGKLVPTEAELACSEGRDYEPADVLLERILRERREKWNGKGKYKEPVAPDTSGLAELPEGWGWTTLEQLSWNSGYGTSEKCDYNFSGPSVLRIPNISEGCITLNDIKFASESTNLNETESLAYGDMLVIRTNGSKNLIGRAGVVTQIFNKPYFFASYLIRFRIVEYGRLPIWLSSIWHTPRIREWIESVAATSAGQYNISMSKLNKLPLELPPLAEQHRIVTEVERRLSICDNMEKTISQSLQKAESLRQSILKRAFEGKLLNERELEEVRSATDWEPAEKLLERIKAEKTNTKAKKRGKK